MEVCAHGTSKGAFSDLETIFWSTLHEGPLSGKEGGGNCTETPGEIFYSSSSSSRTSSCNDCSCSSSSNNSLTVADGGGDN